MRWRVLLIPLLPCALALPWDPNQLTSQQIRNIAWGSGTCDHARYPSECVTADAAAAYIRNAFVRYEISSPEQQAAVISVMAYESEDFKLSRDHEPDVIGTETRNMQSASFNQQYAASIPELNRFTRVCNDSSIILDLLVSEPRWDFGSAAWFLTTQCTQEQRARLKTGSDKAWEDYVVNCLGHPVTPERREYWNRAIYELVRSK
ncbi:hypothetical protein EYB25_009360 [Talaromyces marneffei]|nr:hypothetical protein EYB25_009360 [Talaromyces marneffei]